MELKLHSNIDAEKLPWHATIFNFSAFSISVSENKNLCAIIGAVNSAWKNNEIQTDWIGKKNELLKFAMNPIIKFTFDDCFFSRSEFESHKSKFFHSRFKQVVFFFVFLLSKKECVFIWIFISNFTYQNFHDFTKKQTTSTKRIAIDTNTNSNVFKTKKISNE